MSTHVDNLDGKNEKSGLRRGKSITPRKFKSPFPQDELPHCFSICLDWLSLMVECVWPEPIDGELIYHVNEDTVVEYTGKGTTMFKHSFKVYLYGEPVANFHAHPKSEKFMKAGTAKLEMLNHTLYSTEYIEILNKVMIACKMPVIKNLSRMDIAIDGANHVHTFINKYVNQSKNRSRPDLQSIGTWQKENRVRLKGKARFDSKMFNKKTGLYDSFHIGSARKKFVLYNKTQEIDQRSHKEYIRDMWRRAGLDIEKEVWRCELRLNSEGIKDIKDLDINKLSDPLYLLQIYKTQCKNFVEFVDMEGQTNVTYARIIDLFQLEKMKIPLLEKVSRSVVDGAYKAKMSIHNAVKDILIYNLHYVEKISYDVKAAMQHITDNINRYNLSRWYERKILEWKVLYVPQLTSG